MFFYVKEHTVAIKIDTVENNLKSKVHSKNKCLEKLVEEVRGIR